MNSYTTIQLLSENGSRGYLDVKEDVSIPLNFTASDIRAIESRSGSFSKTITLKASANNNLLLNNYFDVNIQAGTFNLQKRHNCVIIQNGTIILDNGYLRLLSVKKSQKSYTHDELAEYEIQVRDGIGDFFKELNNAELTDLDFSDYNHISNAQAVKNTFSNDSSDGYKYILPWIDDWGYDLKECFPGIYALEYWKRIHERAGFEWSWDEYSGDTYFDKLIIPFNGDATKVNEDVSKEVEVIVQTTGSTMILNLDDYHYSPTSSLLNNNFIKYDFSEVIKDNFSRWNNATDEYTNQYVINPPHNLNFEFEFDWDIVLHNNENVPLRLETNTSVSPNSMFKDVGGFVGLIKNGSSSTAPGAGQYLHPSYTDSRTTVMGAHVTRIHNQYVYTNPFQTGTTVLCGGSNTSVNFAQTWVALNDKFEVVVSCNHTNLPQFSTFRRVDNILSAATNYELEFRIKSVKLRIVPSVDAFGFNYPVTMNNYIPKATKQADILKSFYQMYNLYILIDEDNPKKLIYKSRDKFYDEGKAVDWTEKLARDKEQEVKFVPELSSKSIILTYKQDDKDALLKAYFEETGEIYGQVEVTFDNENVKGVEKKELIFSPTINVDTVFGANCPVWTTTSPKCNIRLLIDNGEQSCGSYVISNYYNNNITCDSYPFVSMLNKRTSPTFDIAYAPCDYYPYDIVASTSNNLYSNYWRRTLAQINNGKLMTAYFNLNEVDVFNMRLSDKIRVDNSWWNINKIIDYNANKGGLTKVELLSIDDDLRLPKIGTPRPKPPKTGKGFDWVTDVLVGVVFEPVLPTGTGGFKPVTWVTDSIKRDRFINTSVVSNFSDAVISGKNNFVSEGVSGVIAGDNFIADKTGVYVGNIFIDGGSGKISNINGVVVDPGINVVYNVDKKSISDVIEPGLNVVRGLGGVRKDRFIINPS